MSQENQESQQVAGAQEEIQSASAETQQDEIRGESETSEAKEGKELEAKAGEEDQAEEEGDQEQPRAKKPGFVKRIDKLTKRLSDRERELEYWREQALKGNAPKPSESSEAKPVLDEKYPDENDYASHADYQRAIIRHEARKEAAQILQAEKQRAQELESRSAHQKQIESYAAKAKEFAVANPDFDEVVADADHVRLSLTVQNAILKHGPELAYALAKDVEKLEELCSMSAIDAAEAIGEIRASMRAQKQEPKPEPKLTKAPPPPVPISSKSSSVRKSIHDEDLPFSEYERMRRDQLRKKA
jgi:hypothetical protein